MARPKKKIEEVKVFQINVRVTLSEQLQLEEIAKSYGLTVIDFVRRRALQKQLPKFYLSRLDRDLVITLSRIGNNLNQLTKNANQGKSELKRLENELLSLNEKLNTIKTELLK